MNSTPERDAIDAKRELAASKMLALIDIIEGRLRGNIDKAKSLMPEVAEEFIAATAELEKYDQTNQTSSA